MKVIFLPNATYEADCLWALKLLLPKTVSVEATNMGASIWLTLRRK